MKKIAPRKSRMARSFRTILYLAFLINCLVFSYAQSAIEITKVSDTIVDLQARTINGSYGQAINGLSFQQDAVITHNGWQYVTYYNTNGHVCIARRQLPTGSWEIIELEDYTTYTNDAHDVISMGISPNDGTIHLVFDHHGSTLRYRVSEPNVITNPSIITWESSLFGPTRNYLEQRKRISGLTYPRFWQTPDGNLQMSYRYGGSGNGDMYLVDYDGSTGQWHSNREVISRDGIFSDLYGISDSRCPYINSFCYGPNGKLHASWCWRETAGGANHDVMYAYSKDSGYVWLNDRTDSIKIFTGRQAGEIQSLLTLHLGAGESNVVAKATADPDTEELITLDSNGVTVVDVGRYYGLMNQQTQAVDPWGRIHLVMWHCSDDSYAYAASQGYPDTGTWGHAFARRYNHYWRDSSGLWHRYEMPWIAGSRPKLFMRQNGDTILIYQSVRDAVALGYGLYFIDGDLTICAATAKSKWMDWKIIHIEPGLFLNEMLGDPYRFEQEEILSVLVQESPTTPSRPTALRILDFAFE